MKPPPNPPTQEKPGIFGEHDFLHLPSAYASTILENAALNHDGGGSSDREHL